VDEKAPSEKDFDEIFEILRQEGHETSCVFNCQVFQSAESLKKNLD